MHSPRSHAWTLLDKWLIVAATVASLFVVSMLIYRYERDYRPSEKLFYGTWQGAQEGTGDTVQWQFRGDHTFRSFILSPLDGDKIPFLTGRWHAGGPYLYLRVSDEDWPERIVSRFDISQDHLTIVTPHMREVVWSFERVAESP